MSTVVLTIDRMICLVAETAEGRVDETVTEELKVKCKWSSNQSMTSRKNMTLRPVTARKSLSRQQYKTKRARRSPKSSVNTNKAEFRT